MGEWQQYMVCDEYVPNAEIFRIGDGNIYNLAFHIWSMWSCSGSDIITK